MAEQVYVTVENVKNPAVKRVMTAASAKINSKKWRIVGTEATVSLKKKEDVKPAVKQVEKIQPVIEPVQTAEFNPEVTEETKPEAFATIGDQVDVEQEEIETLRALYENKAGKPADKRWKADKLNAKIAEL